MKSLLKIVGLFFISANLAFAAGNVNSTTKNKVESPKSVVGSKVNNPTEKGEFAWNPSKSMKPVGNTDKGQIVPSYTHNVKPNNSVKK